MLFVGDDWAEDHHDVEIVDEDGKLLARKRLSEGLDGVTRLHGLIAEHIPPEWADLEPPQAAGMVKVGVETDRGPWVSALVTTGYEVFAITPRSLARTGKCARTCERRPSRRRCGPASNRTGDAERSASGRGRSDGRYGGTQSLLGGERAFDKPHPTRGLYLRQRRRATATNLMAGYT